MGSFMWQSFQGLLSFDGGPSEDSKLLVHRFLQNPAFISVLIEEMAVMLARLTSEYGIEWEPVAPSAEACCVLGISASDVDPLILAAAASSYGELRGCGRESSVLLFGELLSAAVSLTSIRVDGEVLPARLCGACLVANVSCIAGIH